jgi:serine/threonine protein kinase
METLRISDRYEVIRPLGRGSFGQTLLARDRSLEQTVAIKVLHPRVAHDWKTFELFDREAAVLRELRHPGIPAVHEFFRAPWQEGEAAFLVMEYVEGESLAEIIAQPRHLDGASVLHLFLEMLGVLDYLHTRVPPVLHRDIKPGNVIVRPSGSPALVDFGAVRNVFHRADESGSTVVGTYGYMPYEQMMGQASPASDLYALAATFLHLITGRAPPEFMNDAGRLEVPPALPCGEHLRALLARLLSPAPADRFASAQAARSALLEAMSGTSVTAPLPARSTPLSVAYDFSTPTPRPLNGELRALLRKAAYTPGRIIDSTGKGDTGWNIADLFLLGLFSVLTAGVLPAVVWSAYRSRKKRLKRFLSQGLPATARVLDMAEESIGFDIKLTRVRYEFEVDGRLYRDSDQVLPVIARRWDAGTAIQVLYEPDRDFDSVIISPG